MNDGTLFPSIQDGTKRNAVWDRLQTIGVPIPTLQTFFSDLRYLAVARKVMRTLLQINNPKTKMSIDERLGGQHRMIGRLPLGQGRGVVRQGLRELWRFSFQYGLEMTGTARCQPRDHRTQEAAAVMPNMTASVDRTRLWQHFFWLAGHEGISTIVELKRFCSRSARRRSGRFARSCTATTPSPAAKTGTRSSANAFRTETLRAWTGCGKKRTRAVSWRASRTRNRARLCCWRAPSTSEPRRST